MIKIIICDDDKLWLGKAASIIKEYGIGEGLGLDVRTCESPTGVEECFEDGPDIVFMDIEFEGEADTGIDGIAATAWINTTYPGCSIVYLSNYLNYALDVYQTDHVWYVVKEQLKERLPDVLAKITKINDESRTELVIKGSEGSQVRVMCRSIMYLERHDRKTHIVTDDGTYSVHQRIPEIQSKLPEGSFGRCHTSYIVNMSRVISIGEKSLILDDGTEILISRGYSKPFRLRYMDWAGSRAVR